MVLDYFAVTFIYTITFLGITGMLTTVFVVFLLKYPLLLGLYLIWLAYDWMTPSTGGRDVSYCFLSRLNVFKAIKNYFPITLVKTAELDPTKNYIFGYHPHGMLPDGCLVCFGSNAANFQETFPGIKPRVSMVSFFNWLAVFRELVLASGLVSVSRASLEYILTQKGPGHSVVIMIGGSTEVLNTEPSVYNLVLNKRKGFARLALETGSSLVPVFAFGQNDLFHQPKTIFPPKIESWLTKWPKVVVKYSLLIYHDMATLGLTPRRAPITVVVGAPIEVAKVTKATTSQVEELHNLYVSKLNELFENHKGKYGISKNVHLLDYT